MKTNPVYILLPPGERFSPNNAGAVAILVHSMCSESSFAVQVVGDECTHPFLDCSFVPISPFLYRLRSRSRAYANACEKFLNSSEQGIVEIHNRIPLFDYLYNKVDQHKYSLYLHNDPQGMRGAKSSKERQSLIERAHAVYVVSEYIKERFLEGVAGESEKIHVLYNSINFSRLGESLLKKEKIILFVGRMIPEKGALEFAKAIREVLPGNPNWKAVFIGARHFGNSKPTTPYEHDVLKVIKGLGNQVSYKNALPHNEVMGFFKRSEISVVPSVWSEPFGMTALEGMASKCAIVSSDSGGLGEVVGGCGMVIDPESPGSISAAMTKLISDDGFRRELQCRGFKRAKQRFNLQDVVKAHDNIRQLILDHN